MLFTIIRNLVTNAIKFSRYGDSITIEVKESSNSIVVSISDTGIGINEENIKNCLRLKKIFKPRELLKNLVLG